MWIGAFGLGMKLSLVGIGPKKKYPPILLLAFFSDKYDASLWMYSTMSLPSKVISDSGCVAQKLRNCVSCVIVVAVTFPV